MKPAGADRDKAAFDVQRIATGPLRSNCYVVSELDGDAIVIDPGGDPELIERAIATLGAEVRAVLCTHGHHDHLGAAAAIAARYRAPFHLHADDAPLLRRANLYRKLMHGQGSIDIPSIDVAIHDRQILRLESFELRVHHTPGHTPGSVCFEFGLNLFSGDTLLAGQPGRTDFPGGNPRALATSIRRLAERLDCDRTFLRPGHGNPIQLREALEAACTQLRGGDPVEP